MRGGSWADQSASAVKVGLPFQGRGSTRLWSEALPSAEVGQDFQSLASSPLHAWQCGGFFLALLPVIGLLRLVGIMNAAVWFGAAIFLTFFVAPTVFSHVLKQNLGEVWPGVIASMLLERYFVIQYFCAIIALVHAFTEWIYL